MIFNKKLTSKFLEQFFCFGLIFSIAFLLNSFPSESIVAGGDFYQLLKPSEHFSQYFYVWFNQHGQGQLNTISPAYPFYTLLAILDFIGMNTDTISSFYIFFILYGSYLGFFLSIRWIYPEIKKYERIGFSLFYSLNYFTFSIFTYPWGFSHHFLFYIFIPPLIILFLKIFFIKKIDIKYFIIFWLIFLISTISYSNIAFLASLFFIQSILFFIFLKEFPLENIVKKIFIFVFIYIATFGYFLGIIFSSNNKETEGKLSDSVVFGGDITRFLKETSNTILNILSLDINNGNFYSFFIYIFAFLISLFVFFFYKRNGISLIRKSIILGLITCFLILIFLTIRLEEPFKNINTLLYTKLLIIFRSPDKIFVFIPFFFFIILTGIISHLRLNKIKLMIIFTILAIPSYLFYDGSIEKKLRETDKRHSYIVNIPSEYKKVSMLINKSHESTSIISLPYSVTNSINWSDYQKWNFIGHDILYLFYNKNYISANSFDHPSFETKFSFKEYENSKVIDIEKFEKILQKFSAQYIIFHKDVQVGKLKNSTLTQETLSILESNNFLNLLESNDFFDLYSLKEGYIKPIISVKDVNLDFVKINPSQYRIKIKNISALAFFEFHQSFNTQWKLYSEDFLSKDNCLDHKEYKGFNTNECIINERFFYYKDFLKLFKNSFFEESHEMINDYANQWTINPKYIKENFPKDSWEENPDGSINVSMTLYFKPQSYFYLGMFISSIILIGCIGYLGYDFWKGRKKLY
ncbi:MAG: hypothetical protein IPN70_04770 [Candidatus Moraniibacteriota bacterium]|nr:MAG: hypothetical protein IPN70_04770 [Candidatus Moranbacteria bacterium]